ncbi:MAG: secretin N-terminal domain-containing protein [Planctomycetota bacterium]
MKSQAHFAVAVALLVLGAFVPLAKAQDEKEPIIKKDEKSQEFTISFGKDGVAFEDFVETAARQMGIAFVFDARRVSNKKLNMIGKKVVKEEDLFAFYQTLFFAHDLAVISLGPPEAEVLLIEDIKTSQLLKQRAVFVDIKELERRRRNVGEVVATTIQLKHIPVDKAQAALTQIIQEHRAGFVQKIEESNSLLITNFAPTVWTMYEIIQAMDVEVEENQLIFEKLALEYHVAEDLAATIEELIEARAEITSSGSGARNARNRNRSSSSAGQTPAPKIIPDGRNNTLLVYAVPEYMEEIRMLVASLDTAITEANSNIHIYELKNTNAEDIEDVLSDLLSQGGGRSVRPSGGGGNTRGNTAGRGATNQNDPDAVNIVADPNTNSLLITATRARYEEISDIIAKLDKRRPQVLVQCAIVELSTNDIENIGVEIAQVEGGGAETRFFGGSAFGLSTIDTLTNINGGGDTGGDGGGDGGGGAGGSSSNFFDDLVRIPNLGGQGLTAGIFSNFVDVPFLIRLFEETRRGNLVSVPSILVNDNQEAHISVGNEIPTTTVNQGQFSDQSSFGGYQEANLELSISPHISNDEYLRLDIFLSVVAFDGAQTDPAIPPPRTTRELQTQITVPNRRTVVIGGLTNDNFRETVSGIPYLSDIPLIGWLFENTAQSHEQRTLYVFITPTILSEFEGLERLSYERKLQIAKLDGQIHLVDPNFREIKIDDDEVSIEELESSGNFDMPRYRPSSPLRGTLPAQDANKLPMRPNFTKPKPEAGAEKAKASDASRLSGFGRRLAGSSPQRSGN